MKLTIAEYGFENKIKNIIHNLLEHDRKIRQLYLLG